MPPKRPASTAFKPPRPAGKGKSKSDNTGTTAKKSKSAAKTSATGPGRPRKKEVRVPLASSSPDEEDDDDDEEENEDEDEDDSQLASEAEEGTASSPANSPPRQSRPSAAAARSKNPAAVPRQISPSGSQDSQDSEAPPLVPDKLLTALLHSHFQRPDTRIGVDARGLVGKYVETFIREAVARAVVERKGGGAGGGRGSGGDFLEVEDLEKLAPQLILDF